MMLIMGSFGRINHCGFQASNIRNENFNTQDSDSEGRFSHYFCSKNDFNLSHKVLKLITFQVSDNVIIVTPDEVGCFLKSKNIFTKKQSMW